jgi:hypothetical protein
MANNYGYFDEKSAQRIAQAIKHTERYPRNQPRVMARGGGGRGETAQWAIITGRPDKDKTSEWEQHKGKYGWEAIVMGSDGKWKRDPTQGSGKFDDDSGYCREAYGCDQAPLGTVVRLFNSDQDFYLFEFPRGWFQAFTGQEQQDIIYGNAEKKVTVLPRNRDLWDVNDKIYVYNPSNWIIGQHVDIRVICNSLLNGRLEVAWEDCYYV